MLHQYVNTRFRVKRRGKERMIDDYDAIKEIEERRRATVVGTAGCGKTIFMRYLWISLFAGIDAHIPIFVELRRLNSMSTLDLESFIFHSIVPTQEKIDIASFQSWIEHGRFTFVLDGFDEVAADKRDKVQEKILKLCVKSPDNIVIVSGRPDDRFDSWQEFSVFRIEPLNRQQVVQLIERIDFDLNVKKKFVEAIEKGLYAKHQDFLYKTPRFSFLSPASKHGAVDVSALR
jgi:predicted NACHT family NTPase